MKDPRIKDFVSLQSEKKPVYPIIRGNGGRKKSNWNKSICKYTFMPKRFRYIIIHKDYPNEEFTISTIAKRLNITYYKVNLLLKGKDLKYKYQDLRNNYLNNK